MWSNQSGSKTVPSPVLFLALCGVYFLSGRLGLSLAWVNPSASAVWPPTGIAIAAVSLWGNRVWPAIFVGAFFVNATLTGHFPSSLGIACGNTAEALAGGWFLVRAGGPRAFTEPRLIFRFIVLSGMLSTAISATFGSVSLYLDHLTKPGILPSLWLNWWVGDFNSVLIITPLVVLAADRMTRPLVKVERKMESMGLILALVLALVMVHLLVFGGFIPMSGRLYLLGYLGIPLFLYIAFRFGQFPASLAVACMSVIAIWGTVDSRGPFAPEDPDLSLVLLQLYLGCIAVTMMILAAVVWEQKKSRKELDAKQRRLDNIIRSVPGVVWEVWKRQDPEALHLNYVSPYMETLLGYPVEEWLANPRFWLEVVHPEDRESAARWFLEAWESGKGGVSNFRWLAKDGRVVDAETRSVAFLDAEGRPDGMLGVLMDTSERRRTEKRLWLAEQQIQYGRKMDAIGRLAGGVAHDFNNMLTTILGYSDLLREAVQDDARLSAYVDEIRCSGERAASLTRQLLAFSRKEITQPRALNLNDMIREKAGVLDRLVGGGILLRTSLQPDLGCIMADQDQILQVLFNLVANSREAMPEGGVLTVETSQCDNPEGEEGVFLRPKARDCIRLTIRDQGRGIDKDTMGHLFEPFFTTKRLSKEVGLGLSTVYGILERNGGGIAVISEPGRGTVFNVFLPRITGVAGREDGGSGEASATADNLLLVEEDGSARRILTDLLAERGYAVLDACDIPSAKVLVRKCHGSLALSVIDLAGPGRAALELAGSLLSGHPGLRVLFMAEDPDEVILPPGLPLDRIRIVPKVYTPHHLMGMIEELAGTEIPA
ncbi:MAG: multi-sensor hybrid histidine kinase [Fibrobacteres bacterium]|nr:multi-sensor hybrid histidine kinase [Fibrobacterota bacterium]